MRRVTFYAIECFTPPFGGNETEYTHLGERCKVHRFNSCGARDTWVRTNQPAKWPVSFVSSVTSRFLVHCPADHKAIPVNQT
jgi:hypothetical protein